MPEPDLKKLLKAAGETGDLDDLLIVLLCSDAGLRRGELLLVRGEHVQLRETWSAKHGGGQLTVPFESVQVGPKGKRSRSVPVLTKRLHEALKDRQAGNDDPLIANLKTVDSISHRAMAMTVCPHCRKAVPAGPVCPACGKSPEDKPTLLPPAPVAARGPIREQVVNPAVQTLSAPTGMKCPYCQGEELAPRRRMTTAGVIVLLVGLLLTPVSSGSSLS